MADKIVDVTGIGNAIVDVIAAVPEAFLGEAGVDKGTMTLIEPGRSDALHARMGPATEISGGSAANTVVGLAALGGRVAFIGKVGDDALGASFRRDIVEAGVAFTTPPSLAGPATARCLVLVTPDGQRSMLTWLGACIELGPEDIDEELVAGSAVIYLEGYLWDPPRARAAFRKATRIARAAGGQVALSLSDPACVDRHRDGFLDHVDHHVDILFANEHEIMSLFQAPDLDSAIQAVRGRCAVIAITRSEHGAVVLAGEDVHVIAAEPVDNVVDSTGAGDLYAAGFLYGHARGLEPLRCGRLGNVVAGEAITHFGARPQTDLAALAAAVADG